MVCGLVEKRRMGGQPGLGMSSQRGGGLVFLFFILGGVNLTNFASHAKISDFADAHFVYQHVLQLDISVDVAGGMVEILETSHDLPEHRANVIMREGGVSVALENIE